MRMRWSKRLVIGLGVCLVALVGFDLIARSGRDEWGFEAAQAKCEESEAWKATTRRASSSTVSFLPFWRTAFVTFSGKAQEKEKHIKVTLRKHLNILEWYVVDYVEE